MSESLGYYRGVYYDTCESLLKAMRDFGNSKITEVSAREILHKLCEDVFFNARICEVQMTNEKFEEIASDHINRLIYSMLKDKEKTNE